MPTFRKKPVLVEAVEWRDDEDAWQAVCSLHADSELVAFRNDDGTVSIETPAGRRTAAAGDWIVKGPHDHFHLYAADRFGATYEPA